MELYGDHHVLGTFDLEEQRNSKEINLFTLIVSFLLYLLTRHETNISFFFNFLTSINMQQYFI